MYTYICFLIVLKYKYQCTSDMQYISIYRNIDIFIQYHDTILAFGCIDALEFKPGFSNLPDFIPKSNYMYNKLVYVTLIDFFYYFLTNTTKYVIYLLFISISIIILNIVILYRIVILFLVAIRNTRIAHPYNVLIYVYILYLSTSTSTHICVLIVLKYKYQCTWPHA